ncbi:MAG: HpcH/HpaI aldolase/citrate lyase family protein [Alphaproteobacteria bacterium]|nr:HpcH/HpaI aldolase/citrate lyase family protein [Alphaproteobacteria bacterium]
MKLRRNLFKAALRENRPQIGLWSSLRSPMVAEIIGHAGFDWIVLDTEHAPNEIPDLVGQMQAMQAGTAEPVVRVAWNDMVLLKRVLDIGAMTVLIPFVQNAEEAKRAVAFTRYPPQGVRGFAGAPRANRFGKIKDYHSRIHDELCVLVQAETRRAVEAIPEIAAVEGVDGIFIGPADLSADLGHIGHQAHPEVQATIERACLAIRKAGKAAGILTAVESEAKRYLDWGFTFVAVGADTGLVARGADALIDKFKPKA